MNLDHLLALLDGARLTVELVALSCAAGIFLAVPLGVARASPVWWVKALPWAYGFFFRGTPLLVQLFLVYYGLAQFPAVRASVLWPVLREPYWCALIAMTLHTTAYVAEILKGAIRAVPAGEIEAARALGLSRWLVYRLVILPRAARLALPAYANEVVLMLKGSALASTITLLELTGTARTIIAKTYLPVETFLAAGLIYLALSTAVVRGFRRLERLSGLPTPRGPD